MEKVQLRNSSAVKTPCYLYDLELLDSTLQAINAESTSHANYHVHYAIKANANPRVLQRIAAAGLGADCVSGGEIEVALKAGFPAKEIVFAGVGKADWEIRLALEKEIGMFNVESVEELQVINEIATSLNIRARVSFRINPDVGAHTHAHITTGRAEDKFGIDMEDMVKVIRMAESMPLVDFTGLHFHIGSQLLEMDDFQALCVRVNELQAVLVREGLFAPNINVGGGLGIDYDAPDAHPIPDFQAYFDTFRRGLQLREGQQVHFELGRAVVAQMGSLLTRVLYVKHGKQKRFVIVDAGFTELIRPAFYGALHAIQNLSVPAGKPIYTYDVVGPICESSDTFARDYALPETRRGDLLLFRSAGAYGETMSSQYNCRPLPATYTTDDIQNLA
ncbi:MAG: diaminopimelate decarboxylase [Bacteroidaceae bacterium]|nr:diaminopimelate decarboxylase [Bacteroidaceae bacterium]